MFERAINVQVITDLGSQAKIKSLKTIKRRDRFSHASLHPLHLQGPYHQWQAPLQLALDLNPPLPLGNHRRRLC